MHEMRAVVSFSLQNLWPVNLAQPAPGFLKDWFTSSWRAYYKLTLKKKQSADYPEVAGKGKLSAAIGK